MIYEFACDVCEIKWEVQMTMSEHSKQKDNIYCACGQKAYQVVAALNFRLVGDCWHSRGSGNNSHGVGYEMTDTEMLKSRQEVAKMDDVCANMAEKDSM
jgi:hypothetical protein